MFENLKPSLCVLYWFYLQGFYTGKCRCLPIHQPSLQAHELCRIASFGFSLHIRASAIGSAWSFACSVGHCSLVSSSVPSEPLKGRPIHSTGARTIALRAGRSGLCLDLCRGEKSRKRKTRSIPVAPIKARLIAHPLFPGSACCLISLGWSAFHHEL